METLTPSARAAVERSTDLADQVAAHPERYRVLSGDRPTGALHLGHLFGTLAERVRLQNLGVETAVLVADYQVITDRDGAALPTTVRDLVRDYLAVGIDPDRSLIFTHSAVPALNQLLLPFLSLVTEAELHRNPTVKAELAASGRALSGLLLTYPVHQAADILFCRANLVPVGRDQLPHVEQTRVVARRFNERYAPVFPVPQALLTDTPELSGLDGRKMSKSYRNAIALGMGADETAAAIRAVRTDSDRRITFDPDHRPGVSALLRIAALCADRDPQDLAEEVGDAGSGALKHLTATAVNDFLAGHRARRTAISDEQVDAVLAEGNSRANAIAEETLDQVRAAMGMLRL